MLLHMRIPEGTVERGGIAGRLSAFVCILYMAFYLDVWRSTRWVIHFQCERQDENELKI